MARLTVLSRMLANAKLSHFFALSVLTSTGRSACWSCLPFFTWAACAAAAVSTKVGAILCYKSKHYRTPLGDSGKGKSWGEKEKRKRGGRGGVRRGEGGGVQEKRMNPSRWYYPDQVMAV